MHGLILFGGGGHAKVVLEALRERSSDAEITILDDDPMAIGRSILGLHIIGGRDWLAAHSPTAAVIPGLGNNGDRIGLIDFLAATGRSLASAVHPRAVISPSASIGLGSFIAAGAVINAEVDLEVGVIINTGASVDHDCRVGRGAHIAPGVRLCGGVQVGAESLVGTGAIAIPGVRIGARSVIGAGSVVTRNIGDGEKWVGSPARRLYPPV